MPWDRWRYDKLLRETVLVTLVSHRDPMAQVSEGGGGAEENLPFKLLAVNGISRRLTKDPDDTIRQRQISLSERLQRVQWPE